MCVCVCGVGVNSAKNIHAAQALLVTVLYKQTSGSQTDITHPFLFPANAVYTFALFMKTKIFCLG